MMFKMRLLRCKKGLETVTAVLMLFIMLAFMTGLLAAYFNYDSSARIQLTNEGQRSLEQITVTSYNAQQNPITVTILNTGRVDVTIKALYKVLNGQATYYFDPSTNNPTINIAVAKSLTLSFPSNVNLNPGEKITAATESGVTSIDQYIKQPPPTPTYTYSPSRYIYGDIELKWTEFKYMTWQNGNFDPRGTWLPGWSISNPKNNIAWEITVKNIGTKDIILNDKSSFTLDPTGTGSGASPSKSSFYIYNQPVTLPANQEVSIYFVYDQNGNYQGIYSQACVCMVFLTFFGQYSNGGPYGQTIPFEAAIKIS
jgi:hypothetical protein